MCLYTCILQACSLVEQKIEFLDDSSKKERVEQILSLSSVYLTQLMFVRLWSSFRT